MHIHKLLSLSLVILPWTRLPHWNSAEQLGGQSLCLIDQEPVIASPVIPIKRWKSHSQLFHLCSGLSVWYQCGVLMDVLGWLAAYVSTTSANTSDLNKGRQGGYSLWTGTRLKGGWTEPHSEVIHAGVITGKPIPPPPTKLIQTAFSNLTPNQSSSLVWGTLTCDELSKYHFTVWYSPTLLQHIYTNYIHRSWR